MSDSPSYTLGHADAYGQVLETGEAYVAPVECNWFEYAEDWYAYLRGFYAGVREAHEQLLKEEENRCDH